MAGEKIGKIDEAIVKVALDILIKKGQLSGTIFWNKTPPELSSEPDFIVGDSLSQPDYIILVTHFGTASVSHKKCWRNLAELCEAKQSFDQVPTIISVIFDAEMKDALKKIQSAAFDGQLIIADAEYGPSLLSLIDAYKDKFPSTNTERAQYACTLASTNAEFSNYIDQLAEDIRVQLSHHRHELNELWHAESLRTHGVAPIARKTYLRRGFIKRILAGDYIQNNGVVTTAGGEWLTRIGLTKKTISGYQVVDPELSFFMDSPWAADYQTIIEGQLSNGFVKQIQKVRSFRLLTVYGDYLSAHLDALKTPAGMLKCLRTQHKNPSEGLTIPEGTNGPQSMWIYDYLGALIKATNGLVQSFGYSAFTRHPLGKKSKIGNMDLGKWCECFINRYFHRDSSFSIPQEAEIFIATVMSEYLTPYTREQISQLASKTEDMFLEKEYSTTLLAHNGFEPLLALLVYNKTIPSSKAISNVRSCYAERAGVTGRAGKTSIIQVKNTIINWQTATDSGRDHKRKELAGRAVGLRYTWDSENKRFVVRPGIKKLILLLDGTWRQKDLEVLIAAGWDEIYYPDEIDKLKAAIV